MSEFQLVLQFKPWGDRPPDALAAIEDRLEASTNFDAEVDGHDFGSGEGNVFIITSDPRRAMTECVSAVTAEGLLPLLSAGYRRLDENHFIRLWPIDNPEPFDVL